MEKPEEALQRFIHGQWPDAQTVEVREFAPIPGGYSRETYRFDAHVHRGGEWTVFPMILRKDPPPAASILENSRESEHLLLRAVRQHTTIPVSECYFVEMDASTFSEPAMVLERVRGCGEPSLLFNGGANAGQAEAVSTHLCELIAELHLAEVAKLNVDGRFSDPRGVGIQASSWQAYMDSTLEYYIAQYEATAISPLPSWMDALLEIRRTQPRPLRLSLVHGDFNPANFLYEEGRVTALIDWENAHLGDPREDLGWLKHLDLLSNTNIFGSVSADGGFLQHYNRITGFEVTEAEVEWFRVFTSGNIGVPVLQAMKRRLLREHYELLHLYLIQPATVSLWGLCLAMGYPMPQLGGS